MANPQWIQGISGNLEGRPKSKKSTNTIKAKVSRFILKNASPQKLQGLFDRVTARDKLNFIVELLPYVMPRQSQMSIKSQVNSLNQDQLDELYSKVVGEVEDSSFDEIMNEPLLLPQSKTA